MWFAVACSLWLGRSKFFRILRIDEWRSKWRPFCARPRALAVQWRIVELRKQNDRAFTRDEYARVYAWRNWRLRLTVELFFSGAGEEELNKFNKLMEGIRHAWDNVAFKQKKAKKSLQKIAHVLRALYIFSRISAKGRTYSLFLSQSVVLTSKCFSCRKQTISIVFQFSRPSHVCLKLCNSQNANSSASSKFFF